MNHSRCKYFPQGIFLIVAVAAVSVSSCGTTAVDQTADPSPISRQQTDSANPLSGLAPEPVWSTQADGRVCLDVKIDSTLIAGGCGIKATEGVELFSAQAALVQTSAGPSQVEALIVVTPIGSQVVPSDSRQASTAVYQLSHDVALVSLVLDPAGARVLSGPDFDVVGRDDVRKACKLEGPVIHCQPPV